MKTTTYARTFAVPFTFTLTTLIFLLGATTPALAAPNKCVSPDGKVEFSDLPCPNGKESDDKSKGNAGAAVRASNKSMAQLEALFAEYEAPLCEREKLSADIDRANRGGDLNNAPEKWKPKQERLVELNKLQVDFRARAAKITNITGDDSKEMVALRKFQLSLKNCDKPKPVGSAIPSTDDKPQPRVKSAASGK